MPAVTRSQLCRCVITSKDGSSQYAQPSCLCCRGTGMRDKDREKTIDRNQDRRIPTLEECLDFTGAHCKVKYTSLRVDWRCPACNRTKYELLRWTMLFPNTPGRRMGWAVGLHTHHDHRDDQYRYSSKVRPPGFCTRFADTLLCEQCNSADASAKKKLKLPEYFSFSPAEIAMFVTATPNGWHLLDYDIASRIYAQIVGVSR